MTYICFFFLLYWFAPFLKFGPLPYENPRCAIAEAKQIKMQELGCSCKWKQSKIMKFSLWNSFGVDMVLF